MKNPLWHNHVFVSHFGGNWEGVEEDGGTQASDCRPRPSLGGFLELLQLVDVQHDLECTSQLDAETFHKGLVGQQ